VPSAALLVAACLAASGVRATAQEGGERAVRAHPAPALSAESWEGTTEPPTVAGCHGLPLLIVRFDWSDAAAREAFVPMVADLRAANTDLGLTCVALAHVEDADLVRTALAGLDAPFPVGLCGRADAWFDDDPSARDRAFLVGRSGDLLWSGSMADDWPDFYAHLLEAYRRIALPALDDECGGVLLDACATYYAGKLPIAAKQASEADDASVRAAADSLLAKVASAQQQLESSLVAAAESGDAFEFARLERLAKKALDPKEFGPRLRELVRSMRKVRGAADELGVARDWFELVEVRPAFYPARKEKDGDRFSAHARTILGKCAPESRVRAAIEPLLARYADAHE